MQVLLMLTGAMLAPLAGLGLLLWLAHLEETLSHDVQRAQRQPAPPPILAIPVRAVAPAPPALIPEQRAAPLTELSGADGALAT
jgi:hypothetical protein